jgi:hypothetical protein
VTIPDTATIAEQVIAIEAEKHRFGWDKDPELHLLYEGPSGPTSVLAIRTWPAGSAGDALESLSLGLEAGLSTGFGRFAVKRMRALAPGCYAALFLCEAWMADKAMMSREDLAECEAGRGPRLADRVGSVETRTAGAYDLAGNSYFHARIRGRAPVPISIEKASPGTGTGMSGRMPEALARILAVLAGESGGTPPTRGCPSGWAGARHEPGTDR